jgi:5-methylcytosine-specific restriction endonuclease McrA
MRLEELSDVRLLANLDTLVSSQRTCMADIVAHLAELDSRPAVLARGYPSLFQYCVEHLRFSEDEACRRIEAARLVQRFPAILASLASGSVTLSSLALLKHHLTPDNHQELLAGIDGLSCRAAKEWLATRFPAADLPERIRQLPTRVEPLSEDRFALQVTISRSLRDEIELVRYLMRHRNPNGDLETVLGDAIAALRSQLEKQKLGATTKPRSRPAVPPTRAPKATASRHIPSATKRAIVEKDGLRCSFVGVDGRRCECRAFLEFDHVEPVGLDGGHGEDNVRIFCRAHDQYAAARIYGAVTMRRWSSATRASAAPAP